MTTGAIKQQKLITKGGVVIEARNITKNYGYIEALRGANIKVSQHNLRRIT